MMSLVKIEVVKAKSRLCQWCGRSFEIEMSPFSAARFREWVAEVRQHRSDCRDKFLASPAAQDGLNACGYYFLGLA